MHPRSGLLVAAVTTTALLTVASPATATDPAWTQVARGTTGGVSGLAPASSGWVVVRDNKKPGQNRIALLSDAGAMTELTWPGSQPVDLESLSAVPDRTGEYAAVASSGTGYLISVLKDTVTVNRRFTVPRGTRNIEAFALTGVAGTTLAVWAIRGSTTTPATVFAATFDTEPAAFGRVASAKVTVPYPTADVRQVADLTIVSGRLIASSTSDPGNTGPFASALYDLGSVGWTAGRATLTIRTPDRLGTYDGHKVEGVACRGTTGLLGSDDEKLGGWTRTDSFCGASSQARGGSR